MSLEEDILIEHFLRDQLSEEKRNDFLFKIENDQDFRKKFLLEKQLFETLNEEEWSFASKIDETEIKEYTTLYNNNAQRIEQVINKAKTNYNRKSKIRRLVYYSAAAAAIIAILINFYSPANQNTIEEIYVHYSNSYPLPSLVSRNSSVENIDLISVENNFEKKEYQKVLTQINTLLNKDKNNSYLFIYKAISHLELKEYSKAEITLDNLINSNLIDSEKGYWYKSLLYLKTKDLNRCEEILSIIIRKTYFNSKEAEELLNDLSNLKN